MKPNRNALLDFLDQRYNTEEFKTLCFRLYVDYEDLAAETLDGKMREFVRYLERHDRTADLLRRLERDRPEAFKTAFSPLSSREARFSVEQAKAIQSLAQSIACELGRSDGSFPYQQVYARLNSAFQVRSYRDIPAGRYQEARQFLTDWLEKLDANGAGTV